MIRPCYLFAVSRTRVQLPWCYKQSAAGRVQKAMCTRCAGAQHPVFKVHRLVVLSRSFRNSPMFSLQLSDVKGSSPRYLAVGCVLLCLASCSSNQGYGVQQSVRAQQQIGTVASIQIVPQSSMNGTGGALLGAVLGGVVGNQFGGGSGRALATGVGWCRCRESDCHAKSTGQPDLPSIGQAR